MCWNGNEGAEVYFMSKKEILTNMARLSLTGRMNLAIQNSDPWFWLTPYYEWLPGITKEELMSQISVPSFASQYGTPQETMLSTLLRNLEGINPN